MCVSVSETYKERGKREEGRKRGQINQQHVYVQVRDIIDSLLMTNLSTSTTCMHCYVPVDHKSSLVTFPAYPPGQQGRRGQ